MASATNTSSVRLNFLRRRIRARASLAGNKTVPRLSVHRTLRHMYAQIIDDVTGTTLVSSSDKQVKASGTKTATAKEIGLHLAGLAKAKKISNVRFDRGAFKYHGRVAALADGAREGGLSF